MLSFKDQIDLFYFQMLYIYFPYTYMLSFLPETRAPLGTKHRTMTIQRHGRHWEQDTEQVLCLVPNGTRVFGLSRVL
jgi:hypothetical protein